MKPSAAMTAMVLAVDYYYNQGGENTYTPDKYVNVTWNGGYSFILLVCGWILGFFGGVDLDGLTAVHDHAAANILG